MTTIQITLPDALAREADQAGLLSSGAIERMLREHLRLERVERIKSVRTQIATNAIPIMTAEEISAEIDAYRAEQRHASRS